MTPKPPTPFDAAERALMRLEFFPRFGQAPSLADGIWLRTWRTGAKAGQPKIPAAAASMLARGLLELQPAAGPARISRKRAMPRYACSLRIGERSIPSSMPTFVRNSGWSRIQPAIPTTKRSGIPRCRVGRPQ